MQETRHKYQRDYVCNMYFCLHAWAMILFSRRDLDVFHRGLLIRLKSVPTKLFPVCMERCLKYCLVYLYIHTAISLRSSLVCAHAGVAISNLLMIIGFRSHYHGSALVSPLLYDTRSDLHLIGWSGIFMTVSLSKAVT
jgi:hypothetical protein